MQLTLFVDHVLSLKSLQSFVDRILQSRCFRKFFCRDSTLRLGPAKGNYFEPKLLQKTKPLQLVLKQGDLPLQCLDFSFSKGVGLEFFIQLGGGLGELLQGDVQLILHMLHLLLKISDLAKRRCLEKMIGIRSTKFCHPLLQ